MQALTSLPCPLTCSAQVQSTATYQKPFHGHPQSSHPGCQMVSVFAGADSVGLHMRLLYPVQARSTVRGVFLRRTTFAVPVVQCC